MRKFVKLLCVIFALLLLSACAANTSQSGTPPRALAINSWEALGEVMTFGETKGDFAEFKKQTEDKVIYSAIVENDMYAFAELIAKAGLPVLPENVAVDAFSLEYRPNDGLYSVIYRVDGIRYRFWVEPFEKEIRRFGKKIALCEMDGAELAFYKGDGNTLVGEIVSNGYRIQVTVMDLENAGALVFPPFSWSVSLTQ